MIIKPRPFLLFHLEAILAQVVTFTQPADQTLIHYYRQHSQLGANDRALLAEWIFHTLRHYFTLQQRLQLNLPDACAHPVALAALSLYPQLDTALLAEEDQIALQILYQTPTPDTPETLTGLPLWIIQQLQTAYSDETIRALGEHFMQAAPLDLRVNTLQCKRDVLLQKLQQEGIPANATPYSPIGIRLGEKISLQKHPLYLQGAFDIQDEGSQLLGLLLGARRDEIIVDFCAGAGGKTLLFGAQMANRGRLYAFDVTEKRLANLKPRLQRAGLNHVTMQRLTSEHDPKLARLAGKVDRVFVDAPCSGLGTLRRSPDLKLRLKPEHLTAFTEQQFSILEAAAKLVRSGGRLVYATCSLLPQENENIVNTFLEKYPSFQIRDASHVLEQLKIPFNTGGYLTLLPSLHGTDGFFAAVLEKQ